MEVLATLIALFVFVLVYCLPGIIASLRKHHNRAAIWVTTILLGWTTLGWVIALIWSATATSEVK